MKPETVAPTTQDRLATLDEVRLATSLAPDHVLEFVRTHGSFFETSSDFAGVVRYPAEEFEFFADLSDRDDDVVN